MRAIQYDRFGGPEVLYLADVPPATPGPGEVQVALHAASVIPGDCKLRSGLLRDHFDVTFPKIPGRDGAGVVTALGEGVADFAIGDRVCVVAPHTEPGTYAEIIVRPADNVVPLPPGLDFAAGAALMHAGVCAWLCLVQTAAVAAGMRVLVHGGAGAIGGLAVQLARHLGAHVSATCRSSNVAYVQELGAHRVIAYDREDFAKHLAGMDVVLDLVGGATHARSYEVIRPGGHMVCLITTSFENRSAELGVRVSLARIEDSAEALHAVTSLAASGALRPQICDQLPLAEAARAHLRLERHGVSRGRLILAIV